MDPNEFENKNKVRLFNAGDVAEILKISRQEVYKLIQIGNIRAVRIGKSVRVRPQDLDKFIERSLVN
jgi:excisionase family DNA binding protein